MSGFLQLVLLWLGGAGVFAFMRVRDWIDAREADRDDAWQEMAADLDEIPWSSDPSFGPADLEVHALHGLGRHTGAAHRTNPKPRNLESRLITKTNLARGSNVYA